MCGINVRRKSTKLRQIRVSLRQIRKSTFIAYAVRDIVEIFLRAFSPRAALPKNALCIRLPSFPSNLIRIVITRVIAIIASVLSLSTGHVVSGWLYFRSSDCTVIYSAAVSPKSYYGVDSSYFASTLVRRIYVRKSAEISEAHMPTRCAYAYKLSLAFTNIVNFNWTIICKF